MFFCYGEYVTGKRRNWRICGCSYNRGHWGAHGELRKIMGRENVSDGGKERLIVLDSDESGVGTVGAEEF